MTAQLRLTAGAAALGFEVGATCCVCAHYKGRIVPTRDTAGIRRGVRAAVTLARAYLTAEGWIRGPLGNLCPKCAEIQQRGAVAPGGE